MFPVVSKEVAEPPPPAKPLAAEPPPTVEPLAAEPPMAAAQPLSLFLWVHFEGLLLVAESDMISRGGRICCFNLSKVDPLSQQALLLLSIKPHTGFAFHSCSSAIYDR
jgi:hypothetical protein